LSGSRNGGGIKSLSPISYSMTCAEKSLDIVISPLGQAYNDDFFN